MIDELKDMIDYADQQNNQMVKKVLLKIAEFPENKQDAALKLVKMIVENKKRERGKNVLYRT